MQGLHDELRELSFFTGRGGGRLSVTASRQKILVPPFDYP